MFKFVTSYSPSTRRLLTRASVSGHTVDTDHSNKVISGYQFRIFAVLWAIASLFHMAHSSVFDTEVNYALLTLSALYVIFRPSTLSFILFIALQIFDAIYRMPFTTNHWIFTAFVNLTIVQALLYLILKRRSFFANNGELINIFAPVVRIEVIILYFFTAFHKLNSGFFAIDSSCATYLLEAQNISWVFPLTPGVLTFNAYFTVILEFLIPLLLCFRQTRMVAVIIGFIFHGVLAYSTYNAFYDFSSMIFAVYFLFCPLEYSITIKIAFDNFQKKLYRIFKKFNYKRMAVVMLCIAAGILIIYLLTRQFDDFKSVNLYFFWSLYCLVFISSLLFCITSRDRLKLYNPASFTLVNASFCVLPLLVFLNGMSPYLGLKTENSFAMFSNLRTEGGITNHFIMPSSLQIFDFQKDVVDIVSSSDPALQKLADENNQLVLMEFRNYIIRNKPRHVEYLFNGEKREFNFSNESYASLLAENNYVLSKLMKFRQFSKYPPQPCRH